MPTLRRIHFKPHRRHSTFNHSSVPFSWTLLFIAVLTFSVWSIGVTSQPAQEFYTRHTANCKLVDPYTSIPTHQQQHNSNSNSNNIYSSSYIDTLTAVSLYSSYQAYIIYQQHQL